MELVRGRSLAEWARQEPRPGWRECVQVYVQAGEGLAAAHAKGLVHRDFKPGNAVIDDEGRVRVLDFGLARQADDVEQERGTDTSAELDDAALATPLTRTGAVLGTLAYMPLEQMRGGQADARSDQFSFCVSLYEIHPRGSQPRDTTRLLAETLGILRGCPLVRSGRESTRVDGSGHRSSKTLLDGNARDRASVGDEGARRPRQRAPMSLAAGDPSWGVHGPPGATLAPARHPRPPMSRPIVALICLAVATFPASALATDSTEVPCCGSF
jgi:serine/threonine protein kinase